RSPYTHTYVFLTLAIRAGEQRASLRDSSWQRSRLATHTTDLMASSDYSYMLSSGTCALSTCSIQPALRVNDDSLRLVIYALSYSESPCICFTFSSDLSAQGKLDFSLSLHRGLSLQPPSGIVCLILRQISLALLFAEGRHLVIAAFNVRRLVCMDRGGRVSHVGANKHGYFISSLGPLPLHPKTRIPSCAAMFRAADASHSTLTPIFWRPSQ
ncbi:hypothetical protein C8J57DRAFT_1628517, partial [Mycena rebaudengoi]